MKQSVELEHKLQNEMKTEFKTESLSTDSSSEYIYCNEKTKNELFTSNGSEALNTDVSHSPFNFLFVRHRRNVSISDQLPVQSKPDELCLLKKEAISKSAKELEKQSAKELENYFTEDSPLLSSFSIFNDTTSLFFLLMLYTIQGVPMGLGASIPFILQGHVTYNEIGIFSLVSLPFSLKVLWAPIVDSVHFKNWGRRKSWLIPVQLLCVIFMYFGGNPSGVDSWIGGIAQDGTRTSCRIYILVFYFGLLYFLMATQDIVVDGWSLTLLSPENRALSSVCNTIGQTLGIVLAHTGFLALNNPQMCNRWLRTIPSNKPIVTLGTFLQFWSFVILLSTIWALFFPEINSSKHTQDETPKDHFNTTVSQLTVKQTYTLLSRVMYLTPVIKLSLILLTCRIGFAPIDAAINLKLVEAGMLKEEIAFYSPLLIPICLLCPIFMSRYMCQKKKLNLFIYGWILRWLITFFWLGLLIVTKHLFSSRQLNETKPYDIPMWFLILLYVVFAINHAASDIMFSAQMAFFASVSDPGIGGTYMTLLNTLANLGIRWPATASLLTLDWFERVFLKGFSVQVNVFSFLGVVWFYFAYHTIQKLEHYDKAQWLVT